MTPSPCAQPISSADVFEYWADELAAADAARVEDHVFTCAACAAVLAEGEALANGVRLAVRSSGFHSSVSDAVLNRLARDGARMRTFVVSPGDVVPCAVWDDDEVIVTRLRGDFSGVDEVSIVAMLATGEELSRTDRIPIRPGQQELIEATAAPLIRQLPAVMVRFLVTAHRGGRDEPLAEYTLEHAGSLSH